MSKIAIIGSRSVDSMESNLQEAFVFNGHDATIYDIYDLRRFSLRFSVGIVHTIDKIARTYSESYDEKLFMKLFEKVREGNPDIVICVYRFINPLFVKMCKQIGAIVIHVNPDQMTTLEYQQIFASDYDAWLSKDPYMVGFMKNNLKIKAFLYNEAFNKRNHRKPDVSKSVCEREVGHDVVTYGTFYPYRVRMLSHLIDAGIDLKVYGVVPRRFYGKQLEKANQHKYLAGAEKAKILYGSKIVFNQMHFAEVYGVNCRFFEVNGCGAFQLSDYRPILKELLPIDPELVSFKSIDDGIDKIKYYLEHPQERYCISETIYNYFVDRFSYDNLINYILNIINTL